MDKSVEESVRDLAAWARAREEYDAAERERFARRLRLVTAGAIAAGLVAAVGATLALAVPQGPGRTDETTELRSRVADLEARAAAAEERLGGAEVRIRTLEEDATARRAEAREGWPRVEGLARVIGEVDRSRVRFHLSQLFDALPHNASARREFTVPPFPPGSKVYAFVAGFNTQLPTGEKVTLISAMVELVEATPETGRIAVNCTAFHWDLDPAHKGSGTMRVGVVVVPPAADGRRLEKIGP